MTAPLLCVNASLAPAETIIGNDINSTDGINESINRIYSGNKGTKGGGDQSLQFGDQLYGTSSDDIITGGLGIDVLFGHQGNDVLLGGTEDFNPRHLIILLSIVDKFSGSQAKKKRLTTPFRMNLVLPWYLASSAHCMTSS